MVDFFAASLAKLFTVENYYDFFSDDEVKSGQKAKDRCCRKRENNI
jgi:hypothetical protein